MQESNARPQDELENPDSLGNAGSPDNPASSEHPGSEESEASDTEAPPAPEEDATAEVSEVEALQASLKETEGKLLRVAADFDNFRKRSRREIAEAESRARESLIRELLPVFDNLELAVQAAEQAPDAKSVVQGVQMVLRLFGETGERLGLERIQSVDKNFDPNLHDAVQQSETAEKPPGTVLAEITPGYRFGERLIRPAAVVVARPPKPAAEPAEASDTP